MIPKEQLKKEIDRLSDVELEKVYLYLSSLKKTRKSRLDMRPSPNVKPVIPLGDRHGIKKQMPCDDTLI